MEALDFVAIDPERQMLQCLQRPLGQNAPAVGVSVRMQVQRIAVLPYIEPKRIIIAPSLFKVGNAEREIMSECTPSRLPLRDEAMKPPIWVIQTSFA